MTTNFTNILQNMTLGNIEKPKPLPAGSYEALIKNVEFKESTGEKKTPFARVNLEILSALADVDVDALQAFGPVLGKKTKVDFYLTEDAAFRLQEFVLNHVGLDLTGMSLDQAIPQLTNNRVGVRIKQEVSQRDPSTLFAVAEQTFNLGE